MNNHACDRDRARARGRPEPGALFHRRVSETLTRFALSINARALMEPRCSVPSGDRLRYALSEGRT